MDVDAAEGELAIAGQIEVADPLLGADRSGLRRDVRSHENSVSLSGATPLLQMVLQHPRHLPCLLRMATSFRLSTDLPCLARWLLHH